MVVHITNNLLNNGQSISRLNLNCRTSFTGTGLFKGTIALMMEFQELHNVYSFPIPINFSSNPTWKFLHISIPSNSIRHNFVSSHFTLQYSEGLLGPLIIHGPTVENWDIDLGTVLIQDFYRTSIFDVWFTQRSKPRVASDTGLINGKNMNGTIGQYTEIGILFRARKELSNRNHKYCTSTDANFKFFNRSTYSDSPSIRFHCCLEASKDPKS